jgi:hypothetical protein
MWNNYYIESRSRRWMIQLLSYSVVERRVRLEIGRSTPALKAKQRARWSLPPLQTLNSSNKHTCAWHLTRTPPTCILPSAKQKSSHYWRYLYIIHLIYVLYNNGKSLFFEKLTVRASKSDNFLVGLFCFDWRVVYCIIWLFKFRTTTPRPIKERRTPAAHKLSQRPSGGSFKIKDKKAPRCTIPTTLELISHVTSTLEGVI